MDIYELTDKRNELAAEIDNFLRSKVRPDGPIGFTLALFDPNNPRVATSTIGRIVKQSSSTILDAKHDLRRDQPAQRR